MKKFVLGFINLVEKSLIRIPLLLIFLTVMAAFIRIVMHAPAGGQLDPSILIAWKACRNVLYIYYFFAFTVLCVKFPLMGKAADEELKKTFFKWVSGFALMIFSFAIAGLIVDIGFLIFYLGGGAAAMGK